jgi:hypothetical protein
MFCSLVAISRRKFPQRRLKFEALNEGWSGLNIAEYWWHFVHWLLWPCLRIFLVYAISHDLWQFNYNCELLLFKSRGS